MTSLDLQQQETLHCLGTGLRLRFEETMHTTIWKTGILPSESLTQRAPALCKKEARAMHAMPEFQIALQAGATCELKS